MILLISMATISLLFAYRINLKKKRKREIEIFDKDGRLTGEAKIIIQRMTSANDSN